jgi:dephospho-CoA kinase
MKRAYFRIMSVYTEFTWSTIDMIVIGLTGNIGTGKSTVRTILEELGATTIDADKLGHELLYKSTIIYNKLVKEFGRDILDKDNKIDRKKLGDIAFSSKDAQSRLNRIMHATIDREVRKRIALYRKRGDKVVILEAALLVEAKMNTPTDLVWITVAPRDVILRRLKSRQGISEEEILARLEKQMPAEEKIKFADAVIDTDCSMEELRGKVTALWQSLF